MIEQRAQLIDIELLSYFKQLQDEKMEQMMTDGVGSMSVDLTTGHLIMDTNT